jgi:hypothetical protein
MLNNFIAISNAGADIASTNYFQSAKAFSGMLYVSWNASAARILVPDNQLSMIDEMKTGKLCVISRGRFQGTDALEFMFDDDSDSPFAVHIDMRNVDRAIKNDNKPFIVTAWSSKGKLAEWVGKYRDVKSLPCLDPWPKHKSRF